MIGTIEKSNFKKLAPGIIGTCGNNIKPNDIALNIAINVNFCVRVVVAVDIF